jgi:hypothetical protein
MFYSNHLLVHADFPQAYTLSCFLASQLSFLGQIFISGSLEEVPEIHKNHREHRQ